MTASFVSILAVIFICGAKCVEISSGERMDNKETLDKDTWQAFSTLYLTFLFSAKSSSYCLIFDADLL